MTYEEAMKHCIFRYISGSHAYGTNRPDSDEDFRGVFIAPLSSAFQLFQSSFMGSGTIEEHLKNAIDFIRAGNGEKAVDHIKIAMDPEYGDLNLDVGTVGRPGVDEELQELRKFFKLASESNPNIIEFLYVDRLITHETEVWKRIRANRHLFLSKRARFTFAGYAHAQLNRIRNHRGYLMSPPKAEPKRSEFGLPEYTEISTENQGAVLSLPEKWVNEKAKEYVKNEKAFAEALDKWKSYNKWFRERNPYRKELEAKYGFDVKHAMHLIRLCRMGVEILKEGIVRVHRPDAEELKGVLRGEWTYDQLVSYAEGIDASLPGLYETTKLQNKPDHKKIAELYREICEEHYGIKI